MNEQVFKKWAKDHQYQLTKDELGLYTNTHTQSAWEAWKASFELCQTKNKNDSHNDSTN